MKLLSSIFLSQVTIFSSRLLTICLLSLIVAPAAYADQTNTDFSNQNQSFFHLLHPNKSEFEFGFLYEPNHKEDGGPGEFDLENYFANIDVIAPQSQDSFVNFGLNYQLKSYSLKPVASLTNESSLDLHAVPFTLGYGTFLTEDLLVHAQATVGLYSDLGDFPHQDEFQAHAKGLIVYRINPFTQVLAGALHSNDFDDKEIVPLIGFRLQSGGGKLHLSITAPTDATISYFLTPHSTLYLKGSIVGDEYSAILGPKETKFDIRTQDKRFGFGAKHWFGSNFNIGAEIGINLSSDFEFQIPNAGQFNEKTDDAIYGSVRLGFAL